MSEDEQVQRALAMTPAELDAEVDRIIANLNLNSISGGWLPEVFSIVDTAMRQRAREILNLPLQQEVANAHGFIELMRRSEVDRGAREIAEWVSKRQKAQMASFPL